MRNESGKLQNLKTMVERAAGFQQVSGTNAPTMTCGYKRFPLLNLFYYYD
jgi:hypothetical protein